jgi:hypothetical protein
VVKECTSGFPQAGLFALSHQSVGLLYGLQAYILDTAENVIDRSNIRIGKGEMLDLLQ